MPKPRTLRGRGGENRELISGLSATFEVLTGLIHASYGTATVGGVDSALLPTMGFCPRTGGLLDELTGRATLLILATLHGYRRPSLVVGALLEALGMETRGNCVCGKLSTGERRRINVAASLLAQNSLIVLDEPTAGIDPMARPDVWSVLTALRDYTNTAIILSSHSMNKVEALCSRVGILAHGRLTALGTPKRLKIKYSNHYNLKLAMPLSCTQTEVATLIRERVQAAFPGVRVSSSISPKILRFEIPKVGQKLSTLFAKAQQLAANVGATNFSITQASLEDTFLHVAVDKEKDERTHEI